MADQPSSNLVIWDKVNKTNPKYTKQFTRGGGFSGTAINHTYLIQKATEMWGPMGGLWGVNIIEHGLMQGAPLVQDATTVEGNFTPVVVGHEQVHYVRIKLYYPASGDAVGYIEHFGQTTFVGQNKRGFFTDEEAPKKSMTDAIGKALSMLGFSADVFMGMFDDNKYVADARAAADKADEAKAAAKERQAAAKKEAPVPKASVADIEAAKASLKAAKTEDELRTIFNALDKPMQAITKEFARALAKGL